MNKQTREAFDRIYKETKEYVENTTGVWWGDGIKRFLKKTNKWSQKKTTTVIYGLSDIEPYVLAFLDSGSDPVFKEDEQLFSIKFPYFVDGDNYLNEDWGDGHISVGSKDHTGSFKTRFTEQEMKTKYPEFVQFAKPVEDDK